ncbi:MAG: hypothetical protein AAGK97_03920, partial [Bacteroidota bacterium]
AHDIEQKRWEHSKQFTSELTNNARNNFGTWENVTVDTMMDNTWPNYGVVQDLAFDEDDPGKLYVGTHGAGLLRRNNDGSWDDLTFGMPVQGITGIVADSNRIMCLTGSKNWFAFFRFQGVLISEDFGQSWRMFRLPFTDLPDQINTYGLRVHPLDFERQYALTSSGIYMTSDAWLSSIRMTSSVCFDLVFDPIDPDIIYYSNNTKVFKTDTEMTSHDEIFEDIDANRILLTIANLFPFTLYMAALDDSENEATFYKTDDAGITVNEQGTKEEFQLAWNWSFSIHPADNDRLFFGATLLHKSEDGGQTWTDIKWTRTSCRSTRYCMERNQLFTASDGGISYSTSYLKDMWISDYSIGMKNVFITNIDVLNDKFIGGFWHSGTQIWEIGDNISDRINCCDGFKCFYDPYNPSDHYSTTQFPGFSKNGMPATAPSGGSYWGQPFFPDPDDANFLYYCQDRLYRYNKTTEVFQDVNIDADTLRINALGVCKNQSNKGYALMDNGGIPKFVSFTVGSSPLNLTAALPAEVTTPGSITQIIVDDFEPSKVWITINDYDEDNIFFSATGGLTWNFVGGSGLPQVPILSMERIQSNNQIYLGTEYGVYYKDATMPDWIRFSNGLGYQRVVDLDIDNGFVYASVWGSGIWRTPLKSNCPNFRFMYSSSYPNPYSPGYARFEAAVDVLTNLELTTNVGTDIEISGNRKVVLLPGFKASSIDHGTSHEYVSKPRIQIKSEGCQN